MYSYKYMYQINERENEKEEEVILRERRNPLQFSSFFLPILLHAGNVLVRAWACVCQCMCASLVLSVSVPLYLRWLDFYPLWILYTLNLFTDLHWYYYTSLYAVCFFAFVSQYSFRVTLFFFRFLLHSAETVSQCDLSNKNPFGLFCLLSLLCFSVVENKIEIDLLSLLSLYSTQTHLWRYASRYRFIQHTNGAHKRNREREIEGEKIYTSTSHGFNEIERNSTHRHVAQPNAISIVKYIYTQHHTEHTDVSSTPVKCMHCLLSC